MVIAAIVLASVSTQGVRRDPKRDLSWPFGSPGPHGWVEREAALRTEGGRFLDPVAVFGADEDRALVSGPAMR